MSTTPGGVSGCFTLQIVDARAYTGMLDTRHLSMYLLRRARSNLNFDPPKLGDHPPTSDLIASLYQSPLRQSRPLRSCGLQVATHSYYSTMDGLVSTRRGTALNRPCVWFYTAGRRQRSTVPLVDFIQERRGGGSLPSHVFGFI